MIMQTQTYEELSNLLVQSLETKDEASLLKVLEHEDESTVTEIINRVPVHHVRRLIIEIRNILSYKLTANHLKWLQQILVSKFSVISSMADGRSIILPLISLLDDRSSPEYYMKVQALKGKLNLLRQMKESRKLDVPETVVRIPAGRDTSKRMDVDVESETESEEDFDEENGSENDDLRKEGDFDESMVKDEEDEHEEDDDDDDDDDDDVNDEDEGLD